jgi:glutathione S-transferase
MRARSLGEPVMLARGMLKFYYGSGSPIAWRVWLALEYKKIPYELVTLSLSDGDQNKPEFLAVNPRGQIPAIDDDGFCLYEASAILEYLDERGPEPRLFPRDLRERALCRRLVSEAGEHIAPSQFRLARQLFFKKAEDRDEGEISAMRDSLVAELPRFEGAMRGPFVLGEHISAADFTLYPLLAVWRRFELRRPDLGLLDACGPKIRDWMVRIEGLPYFDKTYPPHWRQESSSTPGDLKGRSA